MFYLISRLNFVVFDLGKFKTIKDTTTPQLSMMINAKRKAFRMFLAKDLSNCFSQINVVAFQCAQKKVP